MLLKKIINDTLCWWEYFWDIFAHCHVYYSIIVLWIIIFFTFSWNWEEFDDKTWSLFHYTALSLYFLFFYLSNTFCSFLEILDFVISFLILLLLSIYFFVFIYKNKNNLYFVKYFDYVSKFTCTFVVFLTFSFYFFTDSNLDRFVKLVMFFESTGLPVGILNFFYTSPTDLNFRLCCMYLYSCFLVYFLSWSTTLNRFIDRTVNDMVSKSVKKQQLKEFVILFKKLKEINSILEKHIEFLKNNKPIKKKKRFWKLKRLKLEAYKLRKLRKLREYEIKKRDKKK